MRHPVPPLREDEATRKQRLHHAPDSQKKPRLHMLYLLATRQAQDRQDVARLLGIHRHTIGRWLARDAAGGMDALLATDVPAGTPVSLAPDVLASLTPALRRPAGFASSEALRPWVRQTQGVEVKGKTRYTIVRTRFRTQLKVPRPRHPKKA
jgi:transposase